jgi:Ni2+-binding GTPase involved in maturation of urease and hydrogenase
VIEEWDLKQLDFLFKYPTIFNSADVAVVTKTDLAIAVEFSWKTAYANIQAVRPGMPILKASAKTGEGMEEYLRFLAAPEQTAPDNCSLSNHLHPASFSCS